MTAITHDVLDAITRAVELQQRPNQNGDLTFTAGATTATYDLLIALHRVLNNNDDIIAGKIIKDYAHTVQSYADERTYTLYWCDGELRTITGPDIATAMNNAGYSRGSLAALEMFQPGAPDPNYYWGEEVQSWERYSLK